MNKHAAEDVRCTYVKDEERGLRSHHFRWAIAGHLRGLLVPPLVPALDPGDGLAGSLENEDMLDEGTLFERGVHDSLCSDSLTAPAALVSRDHDATLAVLDTVAEGFGREAGEDDRVHCADAGAGEEGGDGLPGHGEVDGDGVALFDTEGLENVGDGADFAEQLCVGDFAPLARLICLVDDRGLQGRQWVRSVCRGKGGRETQTLSGCLKAHLSTQL